MKMTYLSLLIRPGAWYDPLNPHTPAFQPELGLISCGGSVSSVSSVRPHDSRVLRDGEVKYLDSHVCALCVICHKGYMRMKS